MRAAAILLVLAVAALVLTGPAALGALALRAGWDRVALILLDDPGARGVAHYRLGDHDLADADFARAGRSQTYNRALSLAATGDYPRCSRTITDHCRQNSARESDTKGGRPRRR